MDKINGYFIIQRVDRDKPRYAITFKPDREQIWSSCRKDFSIELDGDQLEASFPGLRDERKSELAQVREEGSTHFTGVFRDNSMRVPVQK
jgi:hypothetical protein